jgi:hypothetical protein
MKNNVWLLMHNLEFP